LLVFYGWLRILILTKELLFIKWIGGYMKDIYSISELVKELKLNKETIRYYEKIGLLCEPKRDKNGYIKERFLW
jgi:hypothetical protein